MQELDWSLPSILLLLWRWWPCSTTRWWPVRILLYGPLERQPCKKKKKWLDISVNKRLTAKQETGHAEIYRMEEKSTVNILNAIVDHGRHSFHSILNWQENKLQLFSQLSIMEQIRRSFVPNFSFSLTPSQLTHRRHSRCYFGKNHSAIYSSICYIICWLIDCSFPWANFLYSSIQAKQTWTE